MQHKELQQIGKEMSSKKLSLFNNNSNNILGVLCFGIRMRKTIVNKCLWNIFNTFFSSFQDGINVIVVNS